MKPAPSREAIAIILILVGMIVAVKFAVRDPGEGGGKGSGEGSRSVEVQPSSRKRSAAGTSGGNESRLFDELRASWEALIPAHGESLFDDQEMKRLLASLSIQETESLARQLLGSQSYPKAATARLMGRWGEFDALSAFAFLEEMEVKNDHFTHFIYVGWVKSDMVAAFEHLEDSKIGQEDPWGLPGFGPTLVKRSAIWKTLTSLEPELALSLICQHSFPVGLEADLNRVKLTTADRDDVMKALPHDSDWAGIAERFSDREFVSSYQPSQGSRSFPGLPIEYIIKSEDLSAENEMETSILTETGLGIGLFARWASIDPLSAFEWHLEQGMPLTEDSNFEGLTLARLFESGSRSESEKPLGWLGEQMRGGEFQLQALEIVRSLRYHARSSWTGLYSQLPSRDERFQVMKSAVEPNYILLGNRLVASPGVVLEVIDDYLPRFNLSAIQEADIRKRMKVFED